MSLKDEKHVTMATNEQLILNVATLTTLMVQALLFIACGNMMLKKYKFLCLIMKGCALLLYSTATKTRRDRGDMSCSVLLSVANILSCLLCLCHLLPYLCRLDKTTDHTTSGN